MSDKISLWGGKFKIDRSPASGELPVGDGKGFELLDAQMSVTADEVVFGKSVKTTDAVGFTFPDDTTQATAATTFIPPNIDDLTLVGNTSGAPAPGTQQTLTEFLDATVSSMPGSLLARGATDWEDVAPGTEDQYLQLQAGSALAWADVPPPTWTTVKKTADQSITSSTTLVDDDELFFSVSANTTYAIRFVLFVVSSTGALKVGINGPASPTSINATVLNPLQVPVTTGNFYMIGMLNAATAYSTALIDTTITNIIWPLEFNVLLKNGANAGTFAVQIAQGVSDAAATVFQAGSYLEWAEI